MPIEIAFPIECLTAIANKFHFTLFVVFLAGMPVAVIGVSKRLAAEAAQDGDIVLFLAMVHQSVLAHKRRLCLRTDVANETYAMGVLDVFFQFRFGLVTHIITLLALVGKASLTVDVLLRLARKFFAASFARHGDGLRAFLIRHRKDEALGF